MKPTDTSTPAPEDQEILDAFHAVGLDPSMDLKAVDVDQLEALIDLLNAPAKNEKEYKPEEKE